MAYYPCPPTAGLTVLEPRAPTSFEKPHGVYPAASGPMALMYGIRNHEYSYGYARDGQIYYAEYFPNALQLLCKGKSARLCLCAPLRSCMRRASRMCTRRCWSRKRAAR